MDASRFDSLAKSLAHGTSRRRVLKGLAGSVAAAVAATAGGLTATAVTCPPGQVVAGNRCVCKATGRPPGPSGCPAGSGQTLCNGVAVDLSSDPNNCDACGQVCGFGICRAGVCQCPPGRVLCDGACVDTAIDPAHCGACGHACGIGEFCVAGLCQCPSGLTSCHGFCVDIATDSTHCGGCDRPCEVGTCQGGVCGCAPGTVACGGVCVAGGCCIAGAAVAAGTVNPANDCQVCQPEIDAIRWTSRADGTPCGEGRCANTCVNGVCPIDVVATPRDCDGRCYWEPYQICHNTTTVCGATVACPRCDDYAARGCVSIDTGITAREGPHGFTCYLLSGGAQLGECDAWWDCTAGPAVCDTFPVEDFPTGNHCLDICLTS